MNEEFDIENIFGGAKTSLFNHLNHHRILFSDAMKKLRFYFATLEDFFGEQERKEFNKLRQTASNIPENKRGDYIEYYYPYHWEFIFKENLKESFLMSLFTYLEFYLLNICAIVAWHTGFSGDIKAVRDEIKRQKTKKGHGSFFEKSKKYLEKLIKNGDFDMIDWGTIFRLWEVRNLITHAQGFYWGLEEKQIEELKNFADETDGVSIREGYISIESSFCKRALITIGKFGSDLGNIVDNNFKKA